MKLDVLRLLPEKFLRYVRLSLNGAQEMTQEEVREESAYLERFQRYRGVNPPEIQEVERDCGFAVDSAWLDKLALHTQIVLKDSEANWSHGRLLYSLLRRKLESTQTFTDFNVLDTGTARGFSALVMARAIIDSGKPGTIVTLDILGHSDKIFSNCIDGVNGAVSRSEIWHQWPDEARKVFVLSGSTSQILKSLHVPRVAFAFLDAQHKFLNVMEEFDWVSATQESGDQIIFDDVSQEEFPGVWEAVEEVRHSRPYSVRFVQSSKTRRYAVATRD